MSLGILNVSSSIVSTQKREPSKYVLDEKPRSYDGVDKFIKQKADEAREVPLDERNAKNWLAISADFVKNVLFKPAAKY